MVANYKQIQLTVDLGHHISFERPDIINIIGLDVCRRRWNGGGSESVVLYC